MTSRLDGVYPAVVTPLDGGGRFTVSAFERLLDRLYSAGVHGVYVGGTTGEGMSQTVRQRKRVAEVAVLSSPPGKRVILHVGANSMDDTLELARHAATVGAAAINSLPPLGLYAFPEICEFYKRLAAAADIPLLLYYFPELSPAIRSLDEILEICRSSNVVGLKFTDFDLFRLSELRREGYTVFNGRDEVFAAGLLMGASGGIGTFYNLMPEAFVRIHDLAFEQRWEEARAVQQEVNRVIRTALRFPIFPAVKTILRWSGIECGECLPPRRPLTARQASELRAELMETCLAPALVSDVRPAS